MSVPFLAAALAYGLSKATVLATSVLAVGQDAASAAAHEGTTGNLSLANTGYDTHRFATLEGRQIRTSAHVDTDRYTGYAPMGAAMTVTGDGTVVADAGAATSRIPAAGVRLSESLATSHETRAAEARTLSRHWSAEAGEARNAAVTDATALVERYSHDVSTGEAYARGITESESSQAQELQSHVDKLAEIGGLTRNQAMNLTAEAKFGGGLDKIVKLGASGAAMWRGQTIESDAWNQMKEYDRQHGVTETWNSVAEASRKYTTQTGELRRRVQPPHHRALATLPGGRRFRPYSIAGIPFPPRTETQHTVVSGTTGSGKTVLISDLVSQIRARGERCVIYDKMGSYTRAFFDRDRDVLMNPLDARAPRWSPFLEARNPRDFDMMAAALIPQQKDTVDPFWVTAARQLYGSKMLLGALYRSELARGLKDLGYDIEKTHADGRFEIAGVSREAIEAFSSRRAEIEAAMEERGLGASGDNPRIAERAALMTRAKKRDIDRDELRGVWQRQAADLGLDAGALVAGAVERSGPAEREAAVEPGSEPGGTREPEAPALPDIGDGRDEAAASTHTPAERCRRPLGPGYVELNIMNRVLSVLRSRADKSIELSRAARRRCQLWGK